MRLCYQGVAMDFTDTQVFRSEPVFDNIAGTDYLFSKYTVGFQAVVAENFVQVVPSAAAPRPPGPSQQINNGVRGQSHPAQRTGVAYRRDSAVVSYPQTESRPGGLAGSPTAPADTPLDGFGSMPLTQSTPAKRGVVDGRLGVYAPPMSGATGRQLYRVVPEDGKATPTMRAIRHRLSTPRGELWLFAGAGSDEEVLIRCPEDGCRMDPKGGPFPRLLGIDAAVGENNTFVLGLQIEFYVNESAANGVSLLDPKALLSNQFVQSHVIDKSGYVTVHTEGEALFRADYVLKNLENPDAFRPLYFLPQPDWAVRENVVVEAIPGTMGVAYRYEDRQTPLKFPAGIYAGAASIDIQHRQALVTDKDVLEGALSVYDRWLQTKVNRQFARSRRARKRGAPPQP